MPRRPRLAGMLVAVIVVSSCSFGGGDAQSDAAGQGTAAPAQGAAERYRAAIAGALAADERCVSAECSSPAGFNRRAAAIADAVRPLDDALAARSSLDAKRMRAVTSALRHSVRQLQTCFELSAAKHGGTPTAAECGGPIADFHRAAVDLRAAFGR